MVGNNADPELTNNSGRVPFFSDLAAAVTLKEDELVIAVRELKHLFTAPDEDPWSPYEVEVAGEPGLLRVVRHLESHKLAQPLLLQFVFRVFTWPQYFTGGQLPKDPKRLVVLLPGDAIESDTTERTSMALRRYCELKIGDKRTELRRTRILNFILLAFGVGFLFLFFFLSVLLSSDKVDDNVWTETFAEGFDVLAWVMLWHPWEALFYDPIPLRNTIRVYKLLMSLQLEIRPQSHD